MATKSHTETLQLAAVLAEFDPTFLAALSRSVESWIAKNAKGPASLAWMTSFCARGHPNALHQMLALMPRGKLEAFVAKVDKHNFDLGQYSFEEMVRHAVQIASGEIKPLPKPTQANGKAKSRIKIPKSKMALSEIVKIPGLAERETELQRLCDSELKSQLNDLGMNAPSGLKKAQRIQFIQEELEAGWPKPRSVLDTSRY